MSYLNENKLSEIKLAISEAERFLEKARLAVEHINNAESSKYIRCSSHHVAAAKRASMDLSRSLVFVRK